MSEKIKFTLNRSEVVALGTYLKTVIDRHALPDLKAWWQGYVVVSALTEIYHRLRERVADWQVFPPAPDATFRLTLTRTQAVALATSTLATEAEGELLSRELTALTYEQAVVRGLVEPIVARYLV